MHFKGEKFLVGGAVRDKLMGKTPSDWDYVVVGGSQADMLANGFKQVGAAFPVFLHPVTGDEYALARTERKTGVGYGGFEVLTDGVTLAEDLSRRDFTINAMAMSDTGELFDPFGGQDDLAKGVIRHVTNAFKDDPLRVLRAARFAARYDFDISTATVGAAYLVPRQDFDALSAERVFLELQKAAADQQLPAFLRNLDELGCADVLSKVMCKWDLDTWGAPIGPFDSDALLTAMCMIALENSSHNPLTDFPGLAMHHEIAKHWNFFRAGLLDLVSLLTWLGNGTSKFNLCCNAVDALGWPFVHRGNTLKEAAAVMWKVTSATVLRELPDLVPGPALGNAIRAARRAALEQARF